MSLSLHLFVTLPLISLPSPPIPAAMPAAEVKEPVKDDNELGELAK